MKGFIDCYLATFPSPVNLGNPDEITIIEFADEILELTNSDQKIIFKPLPEGDPLKRQPDITLAKKLLNWSPKVSRKEGMKITFNYFQNLSDEKLTR